MYGSEVSKDGGVVVRVSLVGEFDLCRREELRNTLAAAGTPGTTVVADLSEVTFMDLESVRELALSCGLVLGRVKLVNPSWQVMASVTASGLGEWLRFDETQPSALSKAS